jgi:DNA-binding transcriptional MerR regulator
MRNTEYTIREPTRLHPERITIRHIRAAILKAVKIEPSKATLNRWKRFLGIKPERVSQRRQYYTKSDLDWLITLATWLQSGRTLDDFNDHYSNTGEHHG